MSDIIREPNSITLIPINTLSDRQQKEWLNFFIPAYQRGYRWGAEQVEQLIDDLLEFRARNQNNNEAFYCIQPLVVRPITKESIKYFEVIDGQQRLTTILIILQVLRQLKYERKIEDNNSLSYGYHIQYETRENSSQWLPELCKTLCSDEDYEKFDNQNCDYSHFVEVFKAAYNKLKDKDLDNFKGILSEKTYFIWYIPSEDDNNNVEIFDRLNAGKIGLNNAELVKALLLQSSNIPPVQNSNMSDRDLLQRIAIEWDNVERELHDDSLWGFIYNKSNHGIEYDSRIEYILDIQQNKTAKEKDQHFYTFNAYLKSYREMMKNGGFEDPSLRMEWTKKNGMK